MGFALSSCSCGSTLVPTRMDDSAAASCTERPYQTFPELAFNFIRRSVPLTGSPSNLKVLETSLSGPARKVVTHDG